MSGNPATDPAFYHGPAPALGAPTPGARPQRAAVPDAADDTPEPADAAEALAEDVTEYHTGGGYYSIPGLDEKIKGKADAQAALDALRAEA